MAEDAGLLQLAELIMQGKADLAQLEKEMGEKFLNKEHKIASWKDALEGAQAIIMEKISIWCYSLFNYRGVCWLCDRRSFF